MQELEQNLSENNKDTYTLKCQNCDANMVFNPQTQQMSCAYCGSSEDFAKSCEVNEIDIANALSLGQNWEEESVSYRCENCGAVVVMPSDQVATLCPYCSTSHVVKNVDSCGVRPNAVYPFTITKDAAETKKAETAKK